MTAEHPNWVAEREKCNMAVLWSDVRDILGIDAQRKNAEEAKQKSGVSYAFPPEEQSATQALLQCSNQAGDLLESCRFVYNRKTSKIEVTTRPPPFFADRRKDSNGIIKTRWDAQTCQCQIVVKIDEAPEVLFPHAQLWKAIQVILEPFFFPVPQKGDG